MLSGIAVMVGGFVYANKRVNPRVRPQRSGVLIILEKPEQKRIRQQINGRMKPVPEELTVARGAAVQIRQSLALALVTMPAYFLIFIPQLVNVGGGLRLIWILLVGFFIGLFVLTVWQFRQTGRFLERTATSIDTGSY
jgi:hypothetical protein